MKTVFVRYFLGVLIFLTPLSLLSQIVDSSFDPVAESNHLAQVPNSPESMAFAKYGNTPVNLYYGTPDIGVPIYTHQGNELNLPINLSYDASGIKVEQLATNVGLGWNLNVGGRISRVVNGMPDDYIVGIGGTTQAYNTMWNADVRSKILEYSHQNFDQKFNTHADAVTYMTFLKDIYESKIDAQPDYFSFNALGVSETFVIDIESLDARALNNPRIKASFTTTTSGINRPYIATWHITLEDGTQLFFNAAEKTHTTNLMDDEGQNFYGFIKEYNSSWVLTQIISPRAKDIYDFDYTPLDYWDPVEGAASYQAVSNPLNNVSNTTNWSSPTNIMGYEGGQRYKIQQQQLFQIKHEGRVIVDFFSGSRCDIAASEKIDRIEIYNDVSGNHVQFRAYNLSYSYFETPNVSGSPCDPSNKGHVRLKLDGIDIKDKSNNTISSYYFEYDDPDDIPFIGSKDQDYMGYYNKANNAVMYPKHPHPYVTDGGSRNPNFNSANNGMLTTIYYPTGGHTEFNYEPNTQAVPDGNNTNWVYQTTLTNFANSLPGTNANACNPVVLGVGEVTPKVESHIINVIAETSYRFMVSESGGSSEIIASENYIPRGLVRLSQSTTALNWSQLFDSSCSPTNEVDEIWELPATGEKFITLTPGTYQLYIANADLNSTREIRVERAIQSTIFKDKVKAGIRIKEITDFTSENNQVLKREFGYSFGTVISQPIYSYVIKDHTWDSQLGAAVESDILHRRSTSAGSNKPHIGYRVVTEKILDSQNSASNGSMRHTFNTTSYGNYYAGIFHSHFYGQQTANYYRVNYELGKPDIQRVMDANNNVISATQTEYTDQEFYINTGIFTNNRQDITNALYPILALDGSGDYVIQYLPPDQQAALSQANSGAAGNWYSGFSGVQATAPSACDSWNSSGSPSVSSELCNPAIGKLLKRLTSAVGNAGNVSITVNSQFEPSGTNTQTTYYDYYDGNDFNQTRAPITITYDGADIRPPILNPTPTYLLKRETTHDSKGGHYYKDYYYAENFSGSEYQGLRDDNMVAIPVQTNTYKDNAKIGSKKTSYYQNSNPKWIETSKGMAPLDKRVSFEEFRNGNLVQSRQPGGAPTTYLWGYDHRYLVAKIENALFSDVENALSVSYTGDFQEKVGAQLVSELDNIRSAFPNSLISVYTYKPTIGLEAMEDASQNRSSYTYDDYGRLEYIKNLDDHILREFDYNYRPTSPPTNSNPPAPITSNGIAYSYDNNQGGGYVEYTGYVLNLTGGDAPYTYDWRYSIQGTAGQFSLGSDPSFSYSYFISQIDGPCDGYDINDPNTYTDITFFCKVTDSNGVSHTVSPKTVTAICYENPQ